MEPLRAATHEAGNDEMTAPHAAFGLPPRSNASNRGVGIGRHTMVVKQFEITLVAKEGVRGTYIRGGTMVVVPYNITLLYSDVT